MVPKHMYCKRKMTRYNSYVFVIAEVKFKCFVVKGAKNCRKLSEQLSVHLWQVFSAYFKKNIA